MSSVSVSAWKLKKWLCQGQKEVKTEANSEVHVFFKILGLGRNDSFRSVQAEAKCVASKQNRESKILP
jgi:hypothetical protein